MKLKLLLLALSALQAVLADTLFTDLIITDVDKGPEAYIRMPQYTMNATGPVTNLTSSDIACGMLAFFALSNLNIHSQFKALLMFDRVQWDY
jgi:hypothetical protein